MNRERYIVQVKTSKGARWEPIGSHEQKQSAINSCAETNRMFKGGESVHRVWDDVNGTEVYRRGWCDQ